MPKQVRWKDHLPIKLWGWDKKNLPSITHPIRTAVAATGSVIIARLVQMPEAYWAVGASVGAIETNCFRANLVAFAIAIFLVGVLSIAFRLQKTAYHYASITLTIIVLIPRLAAPWSIALHRFIEVSVGIIVALAVVALWPEHQPSAVKSASE